MGESAIETAIDGPAFDGTTRDTRRVVLVSMPFGPLFTPSIALGLLASELRGSGFETETIYFTIPFARRIGVQLYGLLSSGTPETSLLVGDWLFRDALFGPATAVENSAYMDILQVSFQKRVAAGSDTTWSTFADFAADLHAVRAAVDGFIDDCAHTIQAFDPMLVGFTTVFQQNVASLALAKRLKIVSPNTAIAFGGANCETVMGTQLLESFPQIDFLVSGEGEQAVVRLAEALASHESRSALSHTSSSPRVALTSNSPADLNALPYPEFDSYFEQAKDTPDIARRTRLLFESSRGCWWGQKSHCTFCGLNGTSMMFRSKDAERALSELDWMMTRYPDRPVSVVDNILDMKYFESFIPRLQSAPKNAELFYEVKANLKKRQLAQLRAANIRRLQPGIESLHDGVLGLMKKGVSALQNVQLLKWSMELGIEPLWNLIWGFPGEHADWYLEMAAIIPQLRHLRPPDSVSEIRLDRFSPLFDDSRLGALNKRPYPAYNFVYAELSPDARFQLAYHFTFERSDAQHADTYTASLQGEVSRWQQAFASSAFFSIALGDQLLLCDLRDPNTVDVSLLDAIDARLYQICDAAHTAETAHTAIGDPSVTLDECSERLAALSASGAMLEIGGRYLGLAIEMNDEVPSVAALQRFQQFLECNNISMDSAVTRVQVRTQRAFT